MKLLIVDDSRAARMLIKSIVMDYDPALDLSEASNGQEAVDIYASITPDIVFLDLTMPVLDGFGALEKIKKINQNAMVVVLTADVQSKSLDRCMELGAYKVVKKLPDKKTVHALLDEMKLTMAGSV